ncbi:MAG: hypothetical protein ACI976_001782 [Aureispira sp.]|jgi:hypothetical protein
MDTYKLIESLEPTLIEVEQFRKKKFRLKQLEYGFYGVGTILFFLIFVSWIAVIFFIILFFVRFAVVGMPKTDYQEKYSNKVTKELVKKLNPAIEYGSNNYKHQELILNSGLLGTSKFLEKSGVLLSGKTKNGYPFQLMEASLVGQVEDGHSDQNYTSFKAMICVLEGTHYLGEHTVIKSKEIFKEHSLSVRSKTRKKEQLTLFSTKHKSVSFNDRHVVYTKDIKEVEALFTTELLQNMDALVQGQKVPMDMVFKEHKLFLLLSGINYFEADISQSLLGTNAVAISCEKIKSSLNLVEKLSALIGGEDGRMKIITKPSTEPLDNADDSAYDHFIGDEL